LLPHPEGWQGGLSVAGPAVSPDRISLFLGLAGWNLLHLAAPLTLPGVYPEIFSPWPGWALAGATVLVAVALGLGMALARKDRVLVFFLVWLAAGLALASNLFPHHVLRAERYLYLPLAALAAITARGAFFASTSAAVGRAARLLPVLAGGLALLTVLSVGAWKDGPSLWSRSLAVYPDNPVAHHYLGQNLMRLGRIAEGLAQHARSFSLYGGYHPLYTRFLNHLVALGRLDDALAYARLGLSAQPDDPRWAENLALVLAARGEVREAAAGLEAFLESRPDSPGVHLSLALLYHRLGEPGRAARHLAEARRLDPLGPCPDRVQGILDARPAPEIGAKAP
ncbi:MAG: tetratricopeptide repeat protein, partial [Pseudomonadota bacterium]